jgi:hypothetical protein
MAHFAQIDENNIVTQVLVVSDQDATRGQDFLANDLGLGGTWIQTSYNTNGGVHANGGTPLRKNYAGIGYTYDSGRDAFIPPKPFNSWLLDEETCLWNAPVARPEGEGFYTWNEENQSWDEVVND